jgi:hypothetical protein
MKGMKTMEGLLKESFMVSMLFMVIRHHDHGHEALYFSMIPGMR